MTLIWFVVWLIANNVGGHEPLLVDPVNAWTATLILAVGLDLGAAHARGGRKPGGNRPGGRATRAEPAAEPVAEHRSHDVKHQPVQEDAGAG